MAEDMRGGFHSVGGRREICGLDSQEQSRSDRVGNDAAWFYYLHTNRRTNQVTLVTSKDLPGP